MLVEPLCIVRGRNYVTGGVAHALGAGVGGQRSQGWQSADASERAEARTAAANVRRWGVGNPDLPIDARLLLPLPVCLRGRMGAWPLELFEMRSSEHET